jgi:hypothetical protein
MAVLAGPAVLFAAPAAVGARHRSVRPVPGRLLRYLSQGPIVFGPAGPRARPRISATVASRDAVRDVQWRPASAVGVSLVRLGELNGPPPRR